MNEPVWAIQFEHAGYRTSGNRALLADLNLSVSPGEILMLLGPSGSGKTTTLKLINGLLRVSEGRVAVDGREIADWEITRLRRHIGYAIKDVGLFPD